MKMKKLILAICFGLLSNRVVFACLPAMSYTEYFGKPQPMSEEVKARIRSDVEENHYTVIDYRIGTSFYPFVRKGDVVYMGGEAIATKKDSFLYLSNGYYQLNHELYYFGKHVGTAPANGMVYVRTEDRSKSKPEDFPPNIMFCPVSAHADILETSDGLHVENLVYDN